MVEILEEKWDFWKMEMLWFVEKEIKERKKERNIREKIFLLVIRK